MELDGYEGKCLKRKTVFDGRLKYKTKKMGLSGRVTAPV